MFKGSTGSVVLSKFALPCRPQQCRANEVSGKHKLPGTALCTRHLQQCKYTRKHLQSVWLWRGMNSKRATLPALRYPLSLGGSVVKNNNNNNNIKTGEEANSGVSAVGNLSFHVRGNSTRLHAANFQLWTKQHASRQHRAHDSGGATSSCVARQKEYPSLWGKTKSTSVEDTEVCEWMGEVAAVPPVWYERKVRGADSIDRVLDPSAHPHHGN